MDGSAPEEEEARSGADEEAKEAAPAGDAEAEEPAEEKKDEVKELPVTKEEGPDDGGNAVVQATDGNKPSNTLHIFNLPSDLEVSEFEMRLSRFGDLVSCQQQEGMLVAKFQRTNDAYKARERLNGTSPYGASLKVDFGPQESEHYNRSKRKMQGRGRKEFLDSSGMVADMGLPKGNNKRGSMRAWGDGTEGGAEGGANKRRKVEEGVEEVPIKAAAGNQKLAGVLALPNKPVSRWSEDLTFEEQLEDYLKMPRRGMYNRYLVLGKLPPELRTGENIWRMMQPVQRDIVQVEMITCFGKPVAHVALRSATAAAAMHRLCEQLHPNLTVAFAPPRRASTTLWLGNVDDFVPRKELEALLNEFGDLENGLKYLPARTCAFASFPTVGDAIAARNHIYGLEVLRNQYLNVDFVDDNESSHDGWNSWGGGAGWGAGWGAWQGGRAPWAAPPWVGKGGGRGEEHGRSDYYGRSGQWGAPPRGRSPPRLVERDRDKRDRRHRSRTRSRGRGSDREATPQRPERRRRREPSPAQDARSASEPAPAPKAKSTKAKVKLYKMGEFCCNIVANFVKGKKDGEGVGTKLQINQRTKIDHCRAHMERAGPLATIWHFSAADRRDCAAYDALCDYFVDKERVGLVQTPSYYVYIVPPTEKYLTELSLPASNFVVGLQIPIKK